MKCTTAEAVVRYLEQEGVKYVFGVPGGYLLPFYDAIYKSNLIRPILTKHESGASYSACGYALVSRKIGVCCGTVGPGATNLISGVAAAYMDSIPMLVITPQVDTIVIGKGALQEASGRGRAISQVGLLSNVCKYSMMETSPNNVPAAVRFALRLAQTGRPGPVHLELPADVMRQKIETTVWPMESYRSSQGPGVEENTIEQLAEHLKNAEHPAMLVGWGAVWSRSDGEVVELAERLQIPVATTLRAKGIIPENHPLALGCLGRFGTKTANSYLRSDIDVLMIVGASMSGFTTQIWDRALVPSKALLQIDIDSSEIGRNYATSISVLGDAKVALREILKHLGAVDSSKNRIKEINDLKAQTGYFDSLEMKSDSLPMKPQRLMAELRHSLPANTIVFGDIGNSLSWVEKYFMASQPYTIHFLPTLAAMGSGTAAAIGGKLAAENTPVVAICGDGDFQMTGMEVLTAVNHRLPVIWVVLNNSRLGMIYDVQTTAYGNRHTASTFQRVDCVAIARAFGAQGVRVEKPQEVEPALTSALKSNQPTVVDALIDPNEVPEISRPGSKNLAEAIVALSWHGVRAVFDTFGKRR